MDRETYQFLQTIFDEGDDSSIDDVPNSRRDRWNVLIVREIEVCQKYLPGSPIVAFLHGALAEFEYKAQAEAVRGVLDLHYLRRLRPTRAEQFVSEFQRLVTAAADPYAIACALAGQLIYELRYLFASVPTIRADTQPTGLATEAAVELGVSAEAASYGSWRAIEQYQSHFRAEYQSQQQAYRHQFDELMLVGRDRIDDLNKTVIDLQGKDKGLRDSIDEAISKMVDSTEDYRLQFEAAQRQIGFAEQKAVDTSAAIATTDQNLALFKTSVLEQMKIEATRKLWSSRAFRNALAFAISALLLAGFLLVIPIYALWNIELVVDGLQRVADATTRNIPSDMSPAQVTVVSISRLVVVSVPIALYFWVIRLLVRFNMRSLAVMDDARQRYTMMETYFHLIEQNAAVKEDRALILNALFRPGPGQGPESVDPPNFVELVDKAMGKS